MIEPRRNPYPKEIGCDVGSIMQAVGGPMDIVYFDPEDRVIAFCNDYPTGLPPNRLVGEQMIRGTFFIAGQKMSDDGPAACSLTDAQIEAYTRMFALPGAEVTQAQIRGIFEAMDEDAPTMGGMT